MRPGEDPVDLAVRVVAELREIAPISVAGRKRAKALAAEPAGGPPPPADGRADLIPPAQ
jgi:hypothetical protein